VKHSPHFINKLNEPNTICQQGSKSNLSQYCPHVDRGIVDEIPCHIIQQGPENVAMGLLWVQKTTEGNPVPATPLPF